MTHTEVAQIDLLDPFLYAGDPGPLYRRLRDTAPVYRDLNGVWGVSRHHDVMAIERNTRLYSSARGSRPLIEMSDSMINKDDPRHSGQRRLVSARFCLGANLARLELRVLFEELLRRLPDFRLVPGCDPEFAPGHFTRTYKEIHIEFTPEGRPRPAR